MWKSYSEKTTWREPDLPFLTSINAGPGLLIPCKKYEIDTLLFFKFRMLNVIGGSNNIICTNNK